MNRRRARPTAHLVDAAPDPVVRAVRRRLARLARAALGELEASRMNQNTTPATPEKDPTR